MKYINETTIREPKRALIELINKQNPIMYDIDRPTWAWDSRNRYTAKLLYRIINTRGIENKLLNNLWGTRAPPKLLVFMWLVHRNSILIWNKL